MLLLLIKLKNTKKRVRAHIGFRLIQLGVIGSSLVSAAPAYSENTAANTAVTQSKKEANYLRVKPNKCISLHKGQSCYQKLKFRWHIVETGKFCLFQQSNPIALVCWENSERSSYQYSLTTTQNEIFQIRKQGQTQSITETTVTRAWVYKTKRKSTSSWRLF